MGGDTHLRRLVAHRFKAFLILSFFATGTFPCKVDALAVSFGHVQLLKDRRTFPARRPRLGAVGRGGGATRIT